MNEAGQISYPLVGEVDVLKLNVLQVKDKITRLLKQGYLKDPNIAIEVVEFRPFYITGEVRAPGSYSYVADMSIMNAVILAGGFTFRAEQDEVEILRNTASGTIMLKDMETDEKVVPGDIILVKERFFLDHDDHCL
ncbi:MAG: polysaccharide export protein [Alphaproteobacteria bacterium]|nr:polysaccharide export protein [Alphaproteobacteria bacterium]